MPRAFQDQVPFCRGRRDEGQKREGQKMYLIEDVPILSSQNGLGGYKKGNLVLGVKATERRVESCDRGETGEGIKLSSASPSILLSWGGFCPCWGGARQESLT